MSIIKHPEQRVAVLIDAQNLYHSAKNLYSKKVNFKNILEDATAGRKLIRAAAYVISSEAGDEQDFFDALIKLGIETKSKDLQIFAGGQMKADWDVGIAVDAMKLANRMDAIVIISGDGDFVPLIEYLQNFTQAEVMAFGQSSSKSLREACDDFIDLSENTRRYLMGNRRRRSTRKKK